MEFLEKKILKYRQKITRYKFIIRPTLFLTIIYFIGIIAILRANVNYIDDMGRVDTGYGGWRNFSRYISTFLSRFIHADKYLTDVSPLPQLIAILILAVSGVILLYVISEKKQFSIWQLVITLPLGLSPYFLECISYKYDSPYMALSILAAIFPSLFYKKGSIKYFIAIVISILVVCTTYQPASGIFPMLVIMLAMKSWNEKEDNKTIGRFIFVSIIGYCLSLLIFKIFIMVPANTYVSNEIASIGEIVPVVINNLKKYFGLIITDFKKIWLVIIALMFCAFIYTVVCNTKRKKYLALPIAIITLVFMLFCIFGVYILLKNPLYDPRAMYGFGVLLAIIAIYICTSSRKYISKILCLLLSWMFFSFSFTYGNALYVQDKYTDYRVALVIEDLENLNLLNNEKNINLQISGTIQLAPNIRNMPQTYNMLNRLIPITFNGDWYWGTYKFFHYYDLKNIYQNENLDLKTYDLPILKDTVYHRIRGNDEYVLVELK